MNTKTGTGDVPASLQEDDLRQRSTKKVKGGSHEFTHASTRPLSYADIYDDVAMGDSLKKSYKETVLGIEAGSGTENVRQEEEDTEEVSGDGPFRGDMHLQIVEKLHGGHACPEIIVPPHAEERLCRPWKQGLLVKLLGRKIGFKALENRLNQMWVEKGTMQIIDLGSDFFLVYLSSQADYNHALTNGPWLIYDHYLTVREWRPNFRPEKEEINRVAVWVRLPELPVEYYNSDFLEFLGNRIGKTVKVDKTTQQLSRGKYARLCVEIDLDAPLLAMFELKKHIYKIEYEGLHLLCMVCGKFGHHKDQCVDRKVVETPVGHVSGEGVNVSHDIPEVVKVGDGPWKVVQKQRWPRKMKDKGVPVAASGGRILPATLNGNNTKRGSRFTILENNEESQEENNEEGGLHGENISGPIIGVNDVTNKKHAVNAKKPAADTSGNRVSQEVNNVSANDLVRDTRGKQQQKTDPPANDTATLLKAANGNTRQVRGSLLSTHETSQHGAHVVTKDTPLLNATPGSNSENSLDQPSASNGAGPVRFHTTRPPDMNKDATHIPNFHASLEDVGMFETDEFMDANEQGEAIASDSEMEVVEETAPFL